MGNKSVQNIILLVATLVIFFFLLETAVRSFAFFYPRFGCDTYSNPDDWFLCSLEFDLFTAGKYNQSAVGITQQICDRLDAELGWVPNPNCRSTRGSTSYSTNSQGFRGTKEFNLEKNRTRIIIVGDSFTWGENDLDNETYPYYLDNMLNGSADVINMGVHGYGPDQFYLYYMRNGARYKPDIVIFGLFLPDIHRTAFNVRSFFKPRFVIENGELKLDPTSLQIPDLKTALKMSSDIKKKNRLYSVSYLIGLYNKIIRLATSYKEETSLTLKIMEQMNLQLKKENAKMVVLLIPEVNMVEKGNIDYYGVVPKITHELQEQSIPYINLQPVFQKETEEGRQSLYAGHLKPAGNKVIARELYVYVKNHPS